MNYEAIDNFKLSRVEILLNVLFDSFNIRLWNENKGQSTFPLIGSLIGGIIVIAVGVTLLPTVVRVISTTENVTGASSTLIGLTPLFFGVAIIGIAIFMCISAFRNAGLLPEEMYDEDEDSEEDTDEETEEDYDSTPEVKNTETEQTNYDDAKKSRLFNFFKRKDK